MKHTDTTSPKPVSRAASNGNVTSIHQLPRSFDGGWYVTGTENGQPFRRDFLLSEHDDAIEAAFAFVANFIRTHWTATTEQGSDYALLKHGETVIAHGEGLLGMFRTISAAHNATISA